MMNAKDLRDALGPMAAPLALSAGWSRTAWDVAVHREKELSVDERERYRTALVDHIKELNRIERGLSWPLPAGSRPKASPPALSGRR